MKLKGGKILNHAFQWEQKDLGIQDGNIVFERDSGEELDISGCLVIPGLIDMHLHGYMGVDLSEAEEKEFDKICGALAHDGITSFLATVSTNSTENTVKALKRISDYMKQPASGSEIIGINMEGPYLSKERKGAMNESYIRKADIDEFKQFYEAADGKIKVMTIAPEIKENYDFIPALTEFGVLPSIGHSNATSAEVGTAVQKGISHATHLFNAMRGLTHREPGVPGAVFDSGITAELICDGYHIDERVIRMCYRLLGRERLILISDGIAYAGMPDGEYVMQGAAVKIENGTCRLLDGTLNGNINSLFECVKRAAGFGIPLEDAVYCASFGPAKRLGIEAAKGSIAAGKDADLIVMDDAFHIKYVLKKGIIVYKGER